MPPRGGFSFWITQEGFVFFARFAFRGGLAPSLPPQVGTFLFVSPAPPRGFLCVRPASLPGPRRRAALEPRGGLGVGAAPAALLRTMPWARSRGVRVENGKERWVEVKFFSKSSASCAGGGVSAQEFWPASDGVGVANQAVPF